MLLKEQTTHRQSSSKSPSSSSVNSGKSVSKTKSKTMEADREEKEVLLPHRPPSPSYSQLVRPDDRYNLVFMIFLYLGVATLLPWNFFITAKHYFDYKFRNTSLPDDVPFDVGNANTKLQTNFESYLSVLSMLSNLVFITIAMIFMRSVSINSRMLVPLAFVVGIFVATDVLVDVDTDSWQEGFFWFTLVSAGIMVGLTAVLTGSTFGLSCLFPPKYTQAVMAGQAVGGTLSAAVNILAIAIAESPTQSAFGFFLTATLCSFFAILMYFALYYLKYSKFFMANQGTKGVKAINDAEELDADRRVYDKNVEMPSSRELLSRRQFLTHILSKIWPYFLSVCLVFLVTLACFPGVVSLITSVHRKPGAAWSDTYFSPVLCFLLFNASDLLGRVIIRIVQWPRSGQTYWILILAVGRLVFLPLFVLCNIHPEHRKYFPVVLDHDAWPGVLNFLLGLSNGYVGTLCMIHAPAQVDLDHAEGAGMVMTLGMTLGLALGSIASLLLVKII